MTLVCVCARALNRLTTMVDMPVLSLAEMILRELMS